MGPTKCRHARTLPSPYTARHRQTCRITEIHKNANGLPGTQGRGFTTQSATRWLQCAGFTLAAAHVLGASSSPCLGIGFLDAALDRVNSKRA